MVVSILGDWLKRIVKNKPLAMPDELAWIRGYYYKKEEFREEDEWRLVTPIKGEVKTQIIGANQDDDFSKVYVSPKAIYYAVNISNLNFEIIDKIAISNGLTRYRMIEDKDTGTLRPEKL